MHTGGDRILLHAVALAATAIIREIATSPPRVEDDVVEDAAAHRLLEISGLVPSEHAAQPLHHPLTLGRQRGDVLGRRDLRSTSCVSRRLCVGPQPSRYDFWGNRAGHRPGLLAPPIIDARRHVDLGHTRRIVVVEPPDAA